MLCLHHTNVPRNNLTFEEQSHIFPDPIASQGQEVRCLHELFVSARISFRHLSKDGSDILWVNEMKLLSLIAPFTRGARPVPCRCPLSGKPHLMRPRTAKTTSPITTKGKVFLHTNPASVATAPKPCILPVWLPWSPDGVLTLYPGFLPAMQSLTRRIS